LEFPATAHGIGIDCPKCGQKTVLTASDPEPEPKAAATETLAASELTTAFTGRIRRTRAPFPYLVGLFLVAGAMLLLPFLYLGLIGLVGWLTWQWAIQAKEIFPNGFTGFYAYLALLTLYLAPLFAGCVLVLFMTKPLFARRAPSAQPLALNPGAEPMLFSFVSQVCQSVGAPFPRRIDVNCQLTAAAGFRRGIWSFAGSDLVLTLGLPLVAGLNTEQLAAVVAHELGHFAQGVGMRLYYLIRRVNEWFLRVVFQRDAWDLMLEESADTRSLMLGVIIATARMAVWSSRQLLRLIMLAGHIISCFYSRQQEYHADQISIQLAGSAVFERLLFRNHILSCALQNSYREMQNTWRSSRALPIDFTAYLLAFDQVMPSDLRQKLEDTLGLARTRLIDTHPSPGDRIRCARQAAASGVFHLDRPARALFSNFEVLSKQVSLLHYSDDLHLPLGRARFYSVGEVKPASEISEPQDQPPSDALPPSKPSRLRIAKRKAPES
jgi:Zn-dependent protease with chaperone function